MNNLQLILYYVYLFLISIILYFTWYFDIFFQYVFLLFIILLLKDIIYFLVKFKNVFDYKLDYAISLELFKSNNVNLFNIIVFINKYFVFPILTFVVMLYFVFGNIFKSIDILWFVDPYVYVVIYLVSSILTMFDVNKFEKTLHLSKKSNIWTILFSIFCILIFWIYLIILYWNMLLQNYIVVTLFCWLSFVIWIYWFDDDQF